MSVNGNDTRRRVLVTLIESDDGLSPSEIGEAIDETRQAVKYHLDTLADMGLIVREDGAYRAQPVFTDEEFEREFLTALGELLPKIEAHIEAPTDMGPEERTTIVFNCLRLFIARELLEVDPDAQV